MTHDQSNTAAENSAEGAYRDDRPLPMRDIDRCARHVVGLVVALSVIFAAVNVAARLS